MSEPDAAALAASDVGTWRTLEVIVTSFRAGTSYGEEEFDKVCEAAYHRYAGTDDEDPGLSMSCGVMTLGWHGDPSELLDRQQQVANLVAACGIEGEITARVVWSAMRTSGPDG